MLKLLLHLSTAAAIIYHVYNYLQILLAASVATTSKTRSLKQLQNSPINRAVLTHNLPPDAIKQILRDRLLDTMKLPHKMFKQIRRHKHEVTRQLGKQH